MLSKISSVILSQGSSVASAVAREKDGGVLLARTLEVPSISSSTSMKLLRYLKFKLKELVMPLCLSFRIGNCCLLRAIPQDTKKKPRSSLAWFCTIRRDTLYVFLFRLPVGCGGDNKSVPCGPPNVLDEQACGGSLLNQLRLRVKHLSAARCSLRALPHALEVEDT